MVKERNKNGDLRKNKQSQVQKDKNKKSDSKKKTQEAIINIDLDLKINMWKRIQNEVACVFNTVYGINKLLIKLN